MAGAGRQGGVLGEPPVQQGFTLDGARRELWQIAPTLAYDTGSGRLSLGAQLPVAGRNLPAGPSLNLGYTLTWSDF
ncbi:MAG: hypothetical protein R3314_07335 [Longimicrobiales bacterium]|nr:hypothetical protein [Longimicrobiales bacterium]